MELLTSTPWKRLGSSPRSFPSPLGSLDEQIGLWEPDWTRERVSSVGGVASLPDAEKTCLSPNCLSPHVLSPMLKAVSNGLQRKELQDEAVPPQHT